MTKKSSDTAYRLAVVLLVAAGVIYLLYRQWENIGAILMVLFGFGGVIMVHEFGHFIVGKLTDMKVTAFSIGFSPVLLGIRKTAAGYHVRILPTLVPKEGGQPEEGALDYTFGGPGKEWETEYRIGLIPFGGFVALLGQEDVGVAEETSDPRSFANKPLLARIAVIMAGVTFNAVSALVIFMIIFHNGIQLQAPVVGDVILNSPADKAGLQAGDEIVSIEGDTFIDFMNVALAGALGRKDNPVDMVVRRSVGEGQTTEFPVSITPVSGRGDGVMKLVRGFGIMQSHSLEIAPLESDEDRALLLKTTGLMEKDVVTAVNGRPVATGIEFRKAVERSLTPSVHLTARRIDQVSSQSREIETMVGLEVPAVTPDFVNRYRLNSVFGMVPLMRYAGDTSDAVKLLREKYPTAKPLAPEQEVELLRSEKSLLPGDVILKVGDREYPTYADLREAMAAYDKAKEAHKKNRSVPFDSHVDVTVSRAIGNSREVLTFGVEPRPSPEKGQASLLGIVSVLNMDEPVVARVIESPKGLGAESIPAGASIISVADHPVNSFYDIVAALRACAGRTASIEWRKNEQRGLAEINVSLADEGISIKSDLAAVVPFDDFRRLYKADNPVQSIVMGWKRTELFIKQAIVTISRLISRDLSPKTLSGPVGIVTATYKIAASGRLSYYFYWLGLISASIAVMNLLPLPILDGGVIVLMLIEKIKGSPISLKIQSAINYAGLVLLAALMLYVTFNDIRNWFN